MARQRKERAAASAAGTQGRDQAAPSPMPSFICRNCGNTGKDMLGQPCRCGGKWANYTFSGAVMLPEGVDMVYPPKHAGGRPTKYNEVAVAAIVTAIKAGATYEHAAAAGGIHYDTFNEWRRNLPEFSEAIKAAEGDAARLLLGKIQAAASGGAWQAAAWILERRWPEQYGRNLHQHRHEGTIKIVVERVNDWRALGKAEIESSAAEGGE